MYIKLHYYLNYNYEDKTILPPTKLPRWNVYCLWMIQKELKPAWRINLEIRRFENSSENQLRKLKIETVLPSMRKPNQINRLNLDFSLSTNERRLEHFYRLL